MIIKLRFFFPLLSMFFFPELVLFKNILIQVFWSMIQSHSESRAKKIRKTTDNFG